MFSYFVNLGSVCLNILFKCIMCFCLIYFNLGNVSSCIDMYLGIFVNRIEVEVEVSYIYQYIMCPPRNPLSIRLSLV